VNINAKLSAGDIDSAMQLAREAYINDVVEPIVLDLMAYRLERQGDLHGALRLLIQAAQMEPQNASIHANVGHCLLKMARPTHALEAFNKALKIDPRSARTHHGAGLALWALKNIDGCEQAQLRAMNFDPNYADPLGTLALIAYERKTFDRAEAFADRALKLNPDDSSALIVKANVLFDGGRVQACADLLTERLRDPTIAPLHRATLERRFGDALDALGDYDAAFAAYTHAANRLRGVYADLFEAPDVETGLQSCERLIDYFQTYQAPVVQVAPDFAKHGAREHVFLMGFPRSGTTLLEQILASHNSITALEERPTLHEAITRYFIDDRNIESLLQAPEAELDRLRQAYWAYIASCGIEVTGKVFVDKQPSLTQYIPLLKILFPHAKILFCIRDPRDVVLGCFRRTFAMNGTIFQYLNIESLAKFYAATMTLGHVYFDKIDIQVHRHKHEALVANFDAEVERLCQFLGLEIDENMRNFVETAMGRDIRTPSAKQVRRGLNASGVAYWRNYERHLAPILPVLQPWVEKFGYA
jgi:tetratricopeptide (TPR) repeat protein